MKVVLLVDFRHTKAEIKRMVLNLSEGHDNNQLARPALWNAKPIPLGSAR